MVQYHSSTLGTSDHLQHGDLNSKQTPRRFPHLFLQGDFNKHGTEVGFSNKLKLNGEGSWAFDLLAEWPQSLQLNEWGINPDGKADQTFVFGDIDKDDVLDRLPPSALVPAAIQLNSSPPTPFLTWKLAVDDTTLAYKVTPTGNRWHQLLVFILMWTIPVLTGSLAIWGYLQS
jgi:alpha-1,3-glucan synthase